MLSLNFVWGLAAAAFFAQKLPKQIIEHIDICYQRINEAVSD